MVIQHRRVVNVPKYWVLVDRALVSVDIVDTVDIVDVVDNVDTVDFLDTVLV